MNIAYREKCIAGCRVDSASTPESSSKYAFVYVPSSRSSISLERIGLGKMKKKDPRRSIRSRLDRVAARYLSLLHHRFIDYEPELSEVSRSEIIGNRLTEKKKKEKRKIKIVAERRGVVGISGDIGWTDRGDCADAVNLAARYSSRYDVINFAFYRVGSTINYSRGT